MEEACSELDLRLAGESHGSLGIGGSTFNQYSVLIEQMSSLKEQLKSQTSHAGVFEQLAVFMSLSLINPETGELLKATRREAGVAREKADQMVL